MSLPLEVYDALIKYIDQKFDLAARAQNKLLSQYNDLIQKQNAILSEGLEFWKHGPAFVEETFEDADEDKIDDSYGQYDVEGQNKAQIHKDWVESGYLDDPLFPKRD